MMKIILQEKAKFLHMRKKMLVLTFLPELKEKVMEEFFLTLKKNAVRLLLNLIRKINQMYTI